MTNSEGSTSGRGIHSGASLIQVADDSISFAGSCMRNATDASHSPSRADRATATREEPSARSPASKEVEKTAGVAVRPLRVLLLSRRDSGHPEGGGSEEFLERIAAGLHRHGHAVTVHCSTYPGAAQDEVVDGVRFIRHGGQFAVYLRAVLYLLRRSRDFDLVVDAQNGLPFFAPLFTRSTVVNVNRFVHQELWRVIFGPVLGRLGWWLESRIAPWVYRRCRYLTVSDATRDDLVRLGVDRDRISVIYSGVDPPAIPVEPKSCGRSLQPSLVVLGRLVPHKRIELALVALAELRLQWPDLTLTVIGRGYWEPALRELAERLGLSDAVRYTGYVDEVTKHRLLAKAWVHLMPSVREGWGQSAIESGMHSTPTVAFATAGGTRESVLNDKTGLLVDSKNAFIDAIHSLLRDERLRTQLGRAARAHARRFSWETATADVEADLRGATYASSKHDWRSPTTSRSAQPRPTRSASGLAGIAGRMLPVAHRSRYREEFAAELDDLIGLHWWNQTAYGLRLLGHALRLRRVVAGERQIWMGER